MTSVDLLLATTAAHHIPGGDISVPLWAWLATVAAIVALVGVDLIVLRDSQLLTLRAAAGVTAAWVFVGLAFGVIVLATLGRGAAGQYYTGYVIEESLSVDNVFLWAVVFAIFAVPPAYHRRVLLWGIFGAMVLRALFIFGGVALLNKFSWVELVFGGFLVFTAVRIAVHDDTKIEPEHNPVFRLVRRYLPVTDTYRNGHMFVKEGGRRWATPLLLVLIFVETTDLLFAVDSVPAVLAVSRSQFIVFTSNAFAILGLRAIYFLLAGVKDALVHLNLGLGVILLFVGVKMIISRWVHIATLPSLAVIVVVLAVTVIASRHTTRRRSVASGGMQ